MHKFFKYWLPVLFWAGFIFFASSLPDKDLPRIFQAQNIIFHIFEYALLALLLNRALKNSGLSRIQTPPKRLLLTIFICLIYAISDEFHQQFTSGRVSSVSDVFIDSLGIVLGSIIYR
ncbi:MAG: VanZ family protein [Candidatus Omnitrophota bacterium]|jgi:VanZ family protein